MIKIYGKTGCASCSQAMTYCDVKGVEYEYLSLGKDYQLSDFVKLKDGHRSFPLIMSDDEYVGTFEDLKIFLNK